MPSFFPRAMPQQTPLTPPEYDQGFPAIGCGGMQYHQAPYSARPSVDSAQEKGGYEHGDHYHQPSAYGLPPSTMYQQQALTSYNSAPQPSITHSGHHYGPIAAPMLPPMRVPERLTRDDTSSQLQQQGVPQQTEHQQCEEKSIGGVAARLDYEMEPMCDFVAEMAQGMYALYNPHICLADIDIIRSVIPGSSVSPAFRKYLSQILSSTRLPSSTILLGLYYLSTRMTMLSAAGRYKASNGQVYRMLTVSLLLGSKFLDDNTFQNRSWSEVSGIAVSELNTLEVEWLVAIEWNLHVHPYEHQGFMTWKSHWEDWNQKALARTVNTLQLKPIDTGVQRQRSLQKTVSSASAYSSRLNSLTLPQINPEVAHSQYTHFQDNKSYQNWEVEAYHRSMDDRSPPSAPETGPTTPEYFGLPGTWAFNAAPPAYSLRPMSTATQMAQPLSQPPSYQHTPYASQYSQHAWNGHGQGCGCLWCVRPHEPYVMSSGFGPQTVAG
ncbi:MAG: hypothetical protein M1812_000376 [Candelaria pacifica]|nr:MAG: hypothetical protein M1812_000376 [Candelaria pacifica]